MKANGLKIFSHLPLRWKKEKQSNPKPWKVSCCDNQLKQTSCQTGEAITVHSAGVERSSWKVFVEWSERSKGKGLDIHLPSSLSMLFSAISPLFLFCFYENVEIFLLLFTKLHLTSSHEFFNWSVSCCVKSGCSRCQIPSFGTVIKFNTSAVFSNAFFKNR